MRLAPTSARSVSRTASSLYSFFPLSRQPKSMTGSRKKMIKKLYFIIEQFFAVYRQQVPETFDSGFECFIRFTTGGIGMTPAVKIFPGEVINGKTTL